jgi:predicted  nucleic acid-binding Zn-ribbon protein
MDSDDYSNLYEEFSKRLLYCKTQTNDFKNKINTITNNVKKEMSSLDNKSENFEQDKKNLIEKIKKNQIEFFFFLIF